jgi:hypothetical protein
MDTLNAMLQDLVYQVSRAQTPASTGQGQQAATDLSDSPPRRSSRFLLNFVGVAEGYRATPFASSQAFGTGLGARGSVAQSPRLWEYGSGPAEVQRSASWSCPAVPISRASSATVASIWSSR